MVRRLYGIFVLFFFSRMRSEGYLFLSGDLGGFCFNWGFGRGVEFDSFPSRVCRTFVSSFRCYLME